MKVLTRPCRRAPNQVDSEIDLIHRPDRIQVLDRNVWPTCDLRQAVSGGAGILACPSSSTERSANVRFGRFRPAGDDARSRPLPAGRVKSGRAGRVFRLCGLKWICLRLAFHSVSRLAGLSDLNIDSAAFSDLAADNEQRAFNNQTGVRMSVGCAADKLWSRIPKPHCGGTFPSWSCTGMCATDPVRSRAASVLDQRNAKRLLEYDRQGIDLAAG